jgi:hypothetical protein
MNAHFRRDYVYQVSKENSLGLEEGIRLYYVRYDRTSKSYIFTQRKGSTNVIIPICHTKVVEAYRVLNKLYSIGYV